MASHPGSIPAGGEGQITLRVRTDNYGGNTIVKHATVYTNDPENAAIPLTITGKVEKVVDISPPQAILRGPVGTEISRTVRITPEEKYAFSITGLKTQVGRYIDARLEKTTYQGRPSYNLVITNKMDRAGNYIDYVYLDTDSRILPKLRIRVRGTISGPAGYSAPSKDDAGKEL